MTILKKKPAPTPERPLVRATPEEKKNGHTDETISNYLASICGGRESYGYFLEARWRAAHRLAAAIAELERFERDADLDTPAGRKELTALKKIVAAEREDCARAAAMLAACDEPKPKESIPATGLTFERHG